jgi:hypothetical protein
MAVVTATRNVAVSKLDGRGKLLAVKVGPAVSALNSREKVSKKASNCRDICERKKICGRERSPSGRGFASSGREGLLGSGNTAAGALKDMNLITTTDNHTPFSACPPLPPSPLPPGQQR